MKLAESHAIILLFLILLVSSSLCIDIMNIGGIEFQNVQTTEKTEKKTSDVIVIKRVETIPKPPVLPDDSVELYITLANNDEQETIKGSVELFDYSIFIPLDATKKDFTLLPLAEKVIKFSLKAPSAEQIANVKVTPRVSFRVNYTFTGVTTYEIVVVNYEEIKKYQQAGKTLNLVTNKIIGSGPIKIDAELVGSDFILAERSGTLKFTVRNEGTGDLKGNKIEKDKMQITFPKGIRVAPPPRATTTTTLLGATTTTTTTLPEKGTSCSNPIDLGSVSKSESLSKIVSVPPYKTKRGDNPRWYRFTARDTGEISIKVTPWAGGMWVEWYEYCNAPHSISGAKATPTSEFSYSPYSVTTPGDDYYIKIDNHESSDSVKDNPAKENATITIQYTQQVQQSANPLELIHVLNNLFRHTGMATGWEIKEYPEEYFNCTGNVCSNGEGAIELYQRESSPLLFKITAPSVDVYRTFQVKAEVNYEYELRGYAEIEIQPLE